MGILSRDESASLLQRAGRVVSGGEYLVSLGGGSSALTRFADNGITQNSSTEDYELTVTVARDGKVGRARTNLLDEDSLRGAVRAAERNAKLAPPDPEWMPVLGLQEYRDVDAFKEATEAFGPEDRASVVAGAVGACRKAGLVAAGTCSNRVSMSALASSAGLFAYHRRTSASFTLTARASDGMGSAKAVAEDCVDVREIPFDSLVEKAIRKAEMSRHPVEIEPGRYTVVLEPEAAAEFVSLLASSLDARAADEGRSFFSVQGDPKRTNKLGEKLFDERVTLASDPWAEGILGSPFDGEGMPAREIFWVEKGVLKNLRTSRYWAKRQGREPTPGVGSYVFSWADQSFEDLIRSVEDGLLISTLWYIRSVDPMKILHTGLTRDGVFRIQDGKVTHPVINFRWNDSPVNVFNNLIGLSGLKKVGSMAVPGLAVRDFQLTSPSKAV